MGSQKNTLHLIRTYYIHKDDYIQCLLCPHQCIIPEGKGGICKTRIHRKGKFYTTNYDNPCTIHVDPIEKKPLYHFLPGSEILSIATPGCNLSCKGCQNFEISRATATIDTPRIHNSTPKDIIAYTKTHKYDAIAYTYTEPTIFFEYMRDIAKLAKKKHIKNVMISNGYIAQEPLKELLAYVDAINIDLKGFTESFYKEYCGARLAPVLQAIVQIHEHNRISKKKCWLELTNLIVPGLNDDPADIERMCRWIVRNIGPDVPLHFSRFYPYDRAGEIPPTPITTLLHAKEIAIHAGIHYVYIGNISDPAVQHTYCPHCNAVLITRKGYFVETVGMKKDKCNYCKKRIAGVF